jgi:hypothetical protein
MDALRIEGRLDHRGRGVHAGKFPGVRARDDDGRAAGDEQLSLIYWMRFCLMNTEMPLFIGK